MSGSTLPGAKVGETRQFDISYAESHSDKSLAGKTATFAATVREARRRQLPELDDAFVAEVSDLHTVEVLDCKQLVLTKKALQTIEERVKKCL